MKIFRLNNGTEFEVDDISSTNSISMTADSDVVKTLVQEVSASTIKNATLGDEVFVNKIYEWVTITPINEVTNKVTATLIFRDKTNDEIINERLNEQDAALMELAELIVG